MDDSQSNNSESQSDIAEPQSTAASQFSRWSSIVLMIAILAVAGAVSALTAMRFAIHGREVEVPALTGKTKEEAEQILRARRLKFKVSQKSQFSPEVPEGRILAQDPPSGMHI